MLSSLFSVLNDILTGVASWWNDIQIDGVSLMSWMLALWALSIVITALQSFTGIGFPRFVGGREAGRYVKHSDMHTRTTALDSMYRDASEADQDSYFDNR